MSSRNPEPEDHARAVRIAARRDLFDDLLRAVGAVPPPEEITQPIPVVGREEAPASWLSPQ